MLFTIIININYYYWLGTSETYLFLCVWQVAMSEPPTPDCHSPQCGEHSRVLSLKINSIFDTTNKTRKNNDKEPAKVLIKQNEKLEQKYCTESQHQENSPCLVKMTWYGN